MQHPDSPANDIGLEEVLEQRMARLGRLQHGTLDDDLSDQRKRLNNIEVK